MIQFNGGLIALDVNSRRTGVAFGNPDSPSPKCLTWALPGCKDDRSADRSFAGLYNSVTELAAMVNPTIVAIEAPFNPQAREEGELQSSHHTVIPLFQLVACARAAAHNAGARVVLGHVQSWRKAFCGHGRPKDPKGATMERCRLLKWDVKNEDEADAAGLWYWAMGTNFPKWSPTPSMFPRQQASG